MIHGEGIVMRLLDKARMVFNLAQRRHGRRHATRRFKQLIDRPHGIVLVTGPTGSRQDAPRSTPPSTRSSDETIKIITVEDPVEYHLRRASTRSRCTARSA